MHTFTTYVGSLFMHHSVPAGIDWYINFKISWLRYHPNQQQDQLGEHQFLIQWIKMEYMSCLWWWHWTFLLLKWLARVKWPLYNFKILNIISFFTEFLHQFWTCNCLLWYHSPENVQKLTNGAAEFGDQFEMFSWKYLKLCSIK